MQRHRAGRLAVLLSLNKTDSTADGIERSTGEIKPTAGPQVEATQQKRKTALERNEAAPGRTPSTTALMRAASSSELSMDSRDERQHNGVITSGESAANAEAVNQRQVDGGLQLSIDSGRGVSTLSLDVVPEAGEGGADNQLSNGGQHGSEIQGTDINSAGGNQFRKDDDYLGESITLSNVYNTDFVYL